jgi:pimeloyl-ACP methyl ester carboxylesterase
MPFLTAPDGVKLHYEAVGSGPALVLQTGGAGDGSMWRDAGYVNSLKSFRLCLLFDHRGHGRSDQPPLAESHTMEAYAADVASLLDHVGVERAAFWGYSQGGEIGLAVAALYPERLTALITTGVITNPDRRADAAETAETIKDIGERGWDALVDPDALASSPAWFQRQVEQTNVGMVARWLEACGDWDPWARLPGVTIPILMFVGELEDPEEWSTRAARIAPNARAVRLAGIDHLGAYARSELVLPGAIEFLSSTEVT